MDKHILELWNSAIKTVILWPGGYGVTDACWHNRRQTKPDSCFNRFGSRRSRLPPLSPQTSESDSGGARVIGVSKSRPFPDFPGPITRATRSLFHNYPKWTRLKRHGLKMALTRRARRRLQKLRQTSNRRALCPAGKLWLLGDRGASPRPVGFSDRP